MQSTFSHVASQPPQSPPQAEDAVPIQEQATWMTFGASSTLPSADDVSTTGSRGTKTGKRPAARGTAFYPRKRANTACQVCRARKTKCDSAIPSCSYCVSVGATCIQSPVDLSSFDPASIKILGRLDDLERILKDLPAAVKENESSPRASASEQQSLSATSATPISATTYPDPEPLCAWSHANHGRAFRPAQQASTSTATGPGDVGLRICNVLPQRVDHILSWPMFRTEMEGLDGEGVNAVANRGFKSWSGGTPSLLSLLESDAGQINRLLDNFFAYVHGSNPILDEPSTRRLVKETIGDGLDWSSSSCLTLIICALGCIATPFGPSGVMRPTAHTDSQVLFEASQKRIGSLLVKNDLTTAQCLFLSGVYMMYMFEPVYSWRFFLQALAICQTLPSIVEARRLGSTPATPPASHELGNRYTQEQAVYWSSWKSERELRVELSLPDFESRDLGITLYPPFFPTPPISNEDAFDKSEAEASRAREAWLFYLADISLRRLTSRMCSAMLDLERAAPSNTEFLMALLKMIPDYEFQARQWRDNLPEELSLAGSIETDNINQFVLRGKMLNFFEIIYWPFVVGSLSRLFASIPVPPDFHDIVTRGLDTQLMQIRINETGFMYRHHGCFFMIRSCTRSALVLLAASKVGAVVPMDWDLQVLKVARMQSYWEEEDVEARTWRCLIERELSAMSR
ncbi:hypothetical protein V2G26_003835 [Clonostachys chloroleuca]